MLLDTLGQLDNAHAYTATAISTNVIDLLPNSAPNGGQTNLIRDIGAGEELHLSILITTTVTTSSLPRWLRAIGRRRGSSSLPEHTNATSASA
jgi:hypothetical protein